MTSEKRLHRRYDSGGFLCTACHAKAPPFARSRGWMDTVTPLSLKVCVATGEARRFVVGDPATWFDQAQKWVGAGASAVVFCPLPSDPVEVAL